MRLRRLTSALVVAWTGVALGPAQAQSASLNVHNVGQVPVVSIQVSPDYKRFWSGNRLAGAIAPGSQGIVDLSGYGDACWFDFLVTDADGNPHAIHGVNICSTNSISVP